MNSKKYIDDITIKYLSGNRYNKLDNIDLNSNVNKDELYFYKKRITNTTRELIKNYIDVSGNIDNNIVNDAFINYANALIKYFKQEDFIDLIKNHNGFIDDIASINVNQDISNQDISNQDISINNQDISINNQDISINNQDISINNQDISINNQDIINEKNKYFIKALNVKKYDWNNFCKVDRKIENNQQPIPKLCEYDLKNPSLRIKGVKNKKSKDNIVKDV